MDTAADQLPCRRQTMTSAARHTATPAPPDNGVAVTKGSASPPVAVDGCVHPRLPTATYAANNHAAWGPRPSRIDRDGKHRPACSAGIAVCVDKGILQRSPRPVPSAPPNLHHPTLSTA